MLCLLLCTELNVFVFDGGSEYIQRRYLFLYYYFLILQIDEQKQKSYPVVWVYSDISLSLSRSFVRSFVCGRGRWGPCPYYNNATVPSTATVAAATRPTGTTVVGDDDEAPSLAITATTSPSSILPSSVVALVRSGSGTTALEKWNEERKKNRLVRTRTNDIQRAYQAIVWW